MSHGIATNSNETSVRTIKLVAAAARSQGDLVRISTGHTSGANVDVAIADDTNVYRVAVVMQDAASGDVYTAAVEGTVSMTVPSATYTAGNGLHILNGAIADSGGAAEDATGEVANNDFGIVNVTGTTVTSIKATLFGVAFTAQT